MHIWRAWLTPTFFAPPWLHLAVMGNRIQKSVLRGSIHENHSRPERRLTRRGNSHRCAPAHDINLPDRGDRQSAVSGNSVSVGVDHGGRRIIKTKHTTKKN